MASRMKDLNVFEPDAMQLAARKVILQILEFGTPLSMLCNCRFTKASLLLYMFSMTDVVGMTRMPASRNTFSKPPNSQTILFM